MKAGDMVRFWKLRDRVDEKPELGLLLEYHSWEKVARILHEGEIISIRAEYVQKAGKKDAAHT